MHTRVASQYTGLSKQLEICACHDLVCILTASSSLGGCFTFQSAQQQTRAWGICPAPRVSKCFAQGTRQLQMVLNRRDAERGTDNMDRVTSLHLSIFGSNLGKQVRPPLPGFVHPLLLSSLK